MKILLIIIAVVLVLGAAFYFLFLKGPNLSRYASLKDPHIITKADQRVIEIPFQGPPVEVLKPAYTLLFQTYFKTKGVPKGICRHPRPALKTSPACTRRNTCAVRAASWRSPPTTTPSSGTRCGRSGSPPAGDQ
jgi:hypothetical protein